MTLCLECHMHQSMISDQHEGSCLNLDHVDLDAQKPCRFRPVCKISACAQESYLENVLHKPCPNFELWNFQGWSVSIHVGTNEFVKIRRCFFQTSCFTCPRAWRQFSLRARTRAKLDFPSLRDSVSGSWNRMPVWNPYHPSRLTFGNIGKIWAASTRITIGFHQNSLGIPMAYLCPPMKNLLLVSPIWPARNTRGPSFMKTCLSLSSSLITA